MKKHRSAALLFALLTCVALCACGNKGPLVRPAPAADAGAAH